MIRLKNLSKTYSKNGHAVHALKNVSLNIETGDIFGIIGLSGAGKSSLIRCINRLEIPTKGEVWVHDHDVLKLNKNSLRQRRQKIGMIFQNFNLLSSKTVYENIAFPLKIAGINSDSIHVRVAHLLKKMGLEDKAHMRPASLSGGQKQRVGIARALAFEPDILLCDEATSALDPKTTKDILALLKEIHKETGITLVVITHEMEVIKSICNKVAVLESGKIVEVGETMDIFMSPSQNETKELIESELKFKSSDAYSTLLQLAFYGEAGSKAILSKAIQETGVTINILSGKIEPIQDRLFGKLIVDVSGPAHIVENALNFLVKESVIVEVLND